MLPRVRHALRRLRRAPAFALAASLTLALGIGATTTVFGVVEGVLLRPLPYVEPARLVDLSHTLDIAGIARVDQSDATYLEYRRANGVFTDVGAYRATAVNLGPIRGPGAGGEVEPERVAAAVTTASTFAVLRVPPLRGRVFGEGDDRPGAAPVVLIGERLWERKYGADPGILGRRLEIDGVAREVVGIMPASFRFPASETALWIPTAIDPARTESATFDLRAVARLRDGVSPAAATADLQRLLLRVPESFPGRLTVASIVQTHMRAVVRPLREVVVGDVGRVLWVLLGAVGAVLLVACANVANLFLVRAEGRQHELAMRRALGASRGALLADLLPEALLLAGAGGALGLALAVAGGQVLRSLHGTVDIPRLAEVGVDATVLAVAIAATALAALVVSAIPALRAGTTELSATLMEGGRSATAGRRRHRARQALVVAQVALALVLVAGAGLMARSFAKLRAVRPGFDAAHALTVRVALPAARYADSASAARFFVRALDAIAALPGVEAAGVVSKLPLDPEARRDTALFVEDRPLEPGQLPGIHQVAYASPDYFRALGIPLLEGRVFDRPDPTRAPHEVIVSRVVAERYWAGGHAVGRRVRLAPRGEWYTVVGVAGDVRGTGLEEPPDETLYLPLVTAPGDAGSTARWAPREVAVVVRGAAGPPTVGASVARVIRALDPAVPVYRAAPMSEVVARAGARTSLTLLLLGVASIVALALGAVGIYGVISYVVSLRTREIAVRLALGARPGEVHRMVSRQAMTTAAVGVGVGLAGALATTRSLGALLFGIAPTDPATLGAAALLLLAVAAAASWLPARRAAAMDPAQALRAE
ncbi:MAG TPA: ABC transporter permease [Gemmatimonadaceae bacterium]|nr:ABC transporter permease [Gemmatimonadaceae bacterium]